MDKSAIDFMASLCYNYTGSIESRYPGVQFSDTAKARYCAVAGWLVGLKMAGKADLAATLADDLDSQFKRLSDGCAFEDIDMGRGGLVRRVPRTKVCVGDDGTFGGFTLAWYRRVSNEQRHAVATERECSLEDAEAHLRIRKELTEHRYYRPDGMEYPLSDSYFYGFSYNGGLLYHGPGGGEVFAVTVDRCNWSIHT